MLVRFGELLPSRDSTLMVSLERGAGDVAPIVRALDEAGIAVETLTVVEPSLDDVFVAKTGRHLEGAEGEPQPEQAQAAER